MGILNIDPRDEHRLRVRLMLQLTGLSFDMLELDELGYFRTPEDWNVFRTVIIGDECPNSLLKNIVYIRGRITSGAVIAISPIDSDDSPAIQRLLDAGANIVVDPRYGMTKSAAAIKRFINWAKAEAPPADFNAGAMHPPASHWAEKLFY